MIANLMMYRRPQLEGAHNRYWGLIRKNLQDAGIDSPEYLSQDAEEFYVWKNPDLVLSQTCGMPYRRWLHDKVALVGTPDFGVKGCPAGYYRSAIVVRKDDPRNDLVDFEDAVFAFNQTFSQSGYAAPYWHMKAKGVWFKNQTQTEQHLKSAKVVAYGNADIASIDAVSWRLMSRYGHFTRKLRVLEWTNPTPALPLITAQGNDAAAIFEAVKTAIAQLRPEDQKRLGIKGIVRISKDAYLSIPNPD